MSKVVVLGFSLDAKDKRFINKMISAVFNEVPEIVDLQSYKYRLKGGERLLIGIGEIAGRDIGQTEYFTGKPCCILPDLEKLDPDTGDDEIRQNVWQQLLGLRKYLDVPAQSEQTTSLTPDQLPVIEADAVPDLEKNHPRGWVGITKDGKSIKLTKTPTTEGSEDIKMTFAELQAIKTAVELLGVREFSLVPSNQANPSPSSSNSGE